MRLNGYSRRDRLRTRRISDRPAPPPAKWFAGHLLRPIISAAAAMTVGWPAG